MFHDFVILPNISKETEEPWNDGRVLQTHAENVYLYTINKQAKRYWSLTDQLQLSQHYCFHYPLRKRFHHYQVFFLRQNYQLIKYDKRWNYRY